MRSDRVPIGELVAWGLPLDLQGVVLDIEACLPNRGKGRIFRGLSLRAGGESYQNPVFPARCLALLGANSADWISLDSPAVRSCHERVVARGNRYGLTTAAFSAYWFPDEFGFLVQTLHNRTQRLNSMTDRSGFPLYILLVACCLMVALPFVLTQYPPITDLPQQSAQIRLFLETLEDPAGSPYKIQWLTPYSLSYVILGGCWALFGPANAGRVAMLAIGLLWVVSIQLTALTRQRAIASGILACVLFFNHTTYWGFYSFTVGLPTFLLWCWVVARTETKSFTWKESLLWLGSGLLLYMSHVLWLVAGVGWFILRNLAFRAPLRRVIARFACIVPYLVITVVWVPVISGSKMATPPIWATGFTSRISWTGMTDAVFGGLRGPTEGLVFGAILTWIIVALWQHRKDWRTATDWELLLAAAMFMAMGLVLPDKFMNTIRFWQRWLPPAAVLLVLAVPAPSWRPVWRQAVALAVVAAFFFAASGKWMLFQRVELSGLQESLAALPQSPRLLGLDLVKRSEVVEGRPFLQIPAYSQVLKGGSLNFSFAEFSPCLVVYKTQLRKPWTSGLDWKPERLRESDFEYFDFALINGKEKIHAVCRLEPRLKPLTDHGRWRLYKVVEP